MRRRYTTLLAAVLLALCASAAAPGGTGTYYRAADGKRGAALKSALRDIVQTATELDYGDLWNCFRTTDRRSDGRVWDMYSDITSFTFGTDQAGNYQKEGDSYNREHSFPQSWFGGSVKPMYTDLHHIYPTDGYVNNQRGNLPLGTNGGETYRSNGGFSKVGACTYSGYSGRVFEPADEYKGDLARTYFYMVTRYEEKLKDWYDGNADGVRATIDGSAYPGLQTWQLRMLLEWAASDPVSDKETARNNAVYSIQKNRNPFIDYPGLEQYIWGSKTDVAFSYDDYDGSGDGGDNPDPGPGDETKQGTYRLTITAADFNSSSYAANNKEKTSLAVCTTDETRSFEVVWTSYQVYKSGGMQWQKNTGCIYNNTDLGTIGSVTITSSEGTFTTYYGTSEKPSSSTAAGGGFFQIKAGGATGRTSKVEVLFTIGEGDDTPGPDPDPDPDPDPSPDSCGWVETSIDRLSATDVFVIVGTHSQGTFALPNEGGTRPAAVRVAVADGKLTGEVADNLQWTLSGNAADGYTFHPNGNTSRWLFVGTTAGSSDNENLRVGTGGRKAFAMSGDYLATKDSYAPRYVCVYSGLEWRGYIEQAVIPTAISFYKRVDEGDEDGIGSAFPSREGRGTAYNLAGQRADDSRLRHGVYIVGGRKMMLK